MNEYNDKTFFKNMKKEVSDYAKDITESFPYFCLKIFWDDFSADDIEEALREPSADGEGIDAFFVDETNKEINIIRCKACESEKKQQTLKKEWLDSFNKVPGNLKNYDSIDDQKTNEIAKEYTKWNNKGFKTTLHFFHLGRAVQNALDSYSDTIKYYGWGDIKNEYQEYLSKIDRTEPVSIDIQLAQESIQPQLRSQQHRTFISLITGDELIKLRQEYRYKLFDKNLRFGLGKNKINTGMINTAQNTPENFYFYNNGITITSKGFKYKETNQKLKIEYPQIINGAQTVNAIYTAFLDKQKKIVGGGLDVDAAEQKSKEHFKRLTLLFRVIEDNTKDGKKTSEFEKNVTRYNNSQTLIKETDFYANELEQIKYQQLFAKFGYFYEIKRGDRKYLESGKEKHTLLEKKKGDFKYWEEKIEMDKLASLWMAYRLDPALDKIQKKNIFCQTGDGNYSTVFEDADKITDEEVKEMILAYNLFDCIRRQAEIYGNKKKGGKIMAKLAKITDNDISELQNAKKMVASSYLFADTLKRDLGSKEKFIGKKKEITERISRYDCFFQGKYITLAIFSLIIKTCKYEDFLIKETDLFQDKEYIDKYLVKVWLRYILDELLVKEYARFKEKNLGVQLRAFYRRGDTWNNIKGNFDGLRYEEDKELNEIFPLTKIIP